MNKKSNTPAEPFVQTSQPGKMRADIVGLFGKMPADTRDIIAQFWVLTLQEQLPEWKAQGDAARKANTSKLGGTYVDIDTLNPTT